MQIIFHIGVHCTDEERLLRTLLRNKDTLLEQGISVPGPSKYRPLLRDALQKLGGNPASEEAQEILLDAILEDEQCERVIFSGDMFLGYPRAAHGGNMLYPNAPERIKGLRNLFPDHEVEFHFSTRDLASFFPAVFTKSNASDFEDFMGHCDLRKFSWAHMVARMRQAVPDAPFVVWANEDSPLIWPEVLEIVSGCAPGTVLRGRERRLKQVMTDNGFARLTLYLEQNPPADTATYAKIAAAFLDKYFDEEKATEEFDLPGWTSQIVDFLSQSYDRDLDALARLPDVDVITP